MAVTREQLEPRWKRLQQAMAAADLDALVLAARGVIAGFGLVVYVAGYTPILRTSYALLRLSGEPILFVPSSADAAIAREKSYLADVRSTGEGDAKRGSETLATALATEIHETGDRRVGIAGLGQIVPVADYLLLQQALPDVELVDATGLVAEVKAVKEPWEVTRLRKTFARADDGYQAAAPLLRPGTRAQAVVAEIERTLRANGASELLVFVDSARHFARRTTESVLEAGDLVTVLVEVATPDGFWVEQGGLFSIGEPNAKSKAMADACYEALGLISTRIAPGASVAHAAAALEEVAERYELATGLGLGHGIGVDHDLPTLSSSDRSRFDVDQVVSVHPNYENPDAGLGAVVAEGFHVTPEGCEQLSGLRHELTVVEG